MQTIGKYHIMRVLGHGGMGTVYEAVDPIIKRKVALKTMIPELAETAELRARFLREAQAAGGLRHRNIVTVYDLGEDKGRPYIAMEFIEGTDLEKVIQNREPYSVEWKLDVLGQICEGLSYAHRNGIVHRDVKPANIRVTPEGEVKIMDFGIAHLQSSNLTKSGLVLGTVHYMAPEQIDGRRVDHRADVFSVGAIAYELLSYRKPFDGESITGVMFKIMHERADFGVLPGSDYSPGLERIIMKALARNVEERYQSLDEMHDDLAALVRSTAPRLMARTQAGSEVDTVTLETRVLGEAEERRGRAASLVEEGRRALAEGQFVRARQCAEQVLELFPDDAAARTLALDAESESLRKRVEQEMAEIQAEMEQARGDGHLQRALGLCKRLLDLDPDDEALAATHAAIQAEIQEKEVDQLSSQALAYAADGDIELAIKIAARIERIAPDSPRSAELRSYLSDEADRRKAEVLIAAAQEHLVEGELEKARDAAEQALAFQPDHAVAREILERASQVLAMRTPVPRSAPPAVLPDTVALPVPDGPVEAASQPAPPPPAVEAKPPAPEPPPAAAKPTALPPASAKPPAAVPAAAAKRPAAAAAREPAAGSAAPAGVAASSSAARRAAPPAAAPAAPQPATPTPPPAAAAASAGVNELPSAPPAVPVAATTPPPEPPPAALPAAPPAAPTPAVAASSTSAPPTPPVTRAEPRPSRLDSMLSEVVSASRSPLRSGAAGWKASQAGLRADGSLSHAPPAGAPPAEAPLTPLPEGPPANVEAASLVDEARRHLRNRSPQKALPLLEQAAALEPSHAGIVRLLELTRVDARRAEIESLTTAALNHFVQNNYGKARKAVEKALALEPENKKAKELIKILGALG